MPLVMCNKIRISSISFLFVILIGIGKNYFHNYILHINDMILLKLSFNFLYQRQIYSHTQFVVQKLEIKKNYCIFSISYRLFQHTAR